VAVEEYRAGASRAGLAGGSGDGAGGRAGAAGPPPQISRTVTVGLLRAADVAVQVAVATLAFQLYLAPRFDPSPEAYALVILLGALLQVNVFHVAGLYRFESFRRPLAQVVRLLVAWTAVLLVLLLAAFLSKTTAQFSRGWTSLWFIGSLAGMTVVRIALYVQMRRWARLGRIAHNILVYGAGPQADRLVAALENAAPGDARVVGVYDDEANGASVGRRHGVTGGVEQLVATARRERIDQVIVALPWSEEARIARVLGALRVLPVDISLSPDLAGLDLPQFTVERVGPVPVVHALRRPLTDWNLFAKEIEDRVLASLILLLVSPVMLTVAALVKLTSPGPVLFRQRRYGFNHRIIEVYKFRTMHHEFRDDNAERLATRDDPRVTPLGRFLRRTSLDELPQFLNVLRGEMSVVGPRPHPLSAKAADRLYHDVVDEYALRHRVKPGITGWAQVNGWRGETDTEEKIRQRVAHDLYYIENWSVGLDLRILLLTLIALLREENAY